MGAVSWAPSSPSGSFVILSDVRLPPSSSQTLVLLATMSRRFSGPAEPAASANVTMAHVPLAGAVHGPWRIHIKCAEAEPTSMVAMSSVFMLSRLRGASRKS